MILQAMYLQQFNISVKNIEGVDNVGAECLNKLEVQDDFLRNLRILKAV